MIMPILSGGSQWGESLNIESLCPQAQREPSGASGLLGTPSPESRNAARPRPSAGTQASAPSSSSKGCVDVCSTKVAPAGRRADLGPDPSRVLFPWLQPECSSRKLSLGLCY